MCFVCAETGDVVCFVCAASARASFRARSVMQVLLPSENCLKKKFTDPQMLINWKTVTILENAQNL